MRWQASSHFGQSVFKFWSSPLWSRLPPSQRCCLVVLAIKAVVVSVSLLLGFASLAKLHWRRPTSPLRKLLAEVATAALQFEQRACCRLARWALSIRAVTEAAGRGHAPLGVLDDVPREVGTGTLCVSMVLYFYFVCVRGHTLVL